MPREPATVQGGVSALGERPEEGFKRGHRRQDNEAVVDRQRRWSSLNRALICSTISHPPDPRVATRQGLCGELCVDSCPVRAPTLPTHPLNRRKKMPGPGGNPGRASIVLSKTQTRG
jgi:hypothetical protein